MIFSKLGNPIYESGKDVIEYSSQESHEDQVARQVGYFGDSGSGKLGFGIDVADPPGARTGFTEELLRSKHDIPVTLSPDEQKDAWTQVLGVSVFSSNRELNLSEPENWEKFTGAQYKALTNLVYHHGVEDKNVKKATKFILKGDLDRAAAAAKLTERAVADPDYANEIASLIQFSDEVPVR